MALLYDKFWALAREKGVTVYRLQKDGALSPSTAQRLRQNTPVSTSTIDALCKALDCQPGDLMEYVPDKEA